MEEVRAFVLHVMWYKFYFLPFFPVITRENVLVHENGVRS